MARGLKKQSKRLSAPRHSMLDDKVDGAFCKEEEILVEEEIPVIEVSPGPKKRKRRSTSKLHAISVPLIPPTEHPTPQIDDDLTLAEWLKRSVSTTGRASSDNTGIKVFQRRKVKFKAIRKRPSEAETAAAAANACSKGEDCKRPSSPVTVCDSLCDCDEYSPNDIAARKTALHCRNVQSPTVVSTPAVCQVSMQCSEMETSIITIDPDDHLEDDISSSQIDVTMEELAIKETEHSLHEDPSIGEFDTLTLPDDSPQVLVVLNDPPTHVIHETDIEEKFLEEFCGDVAQQVPLNMGVTPQNSFLETDDKSVDVGPELRNSEVLNAETRPQFTVETSTAGDMCQDSFVASTETSPLQPETLNSNSHPPAENSESVVTPMELEVAEDRITPVESTQCNEEFATCQTTSTGLDAAGRDAGAAAGRSTSKALFTNSTTNSLSKRNRKSLSPNSRLALIEAAQTERATPTFKIKLMKSKMGDAGSSKLVSRKKLKRKFFPPQDQNPIPDNSSAQDTFQSDMEESQLVASSDLYPLSSPQSTQNSSPDMSALSLSGPSPDSSTHTVPDSLEDQKEPSVLLQTGTVICTPENSVGNLTCTGGSIIISVDCRPGSPTDPCTPNAKLDSPPQPKSILKTRSVDPDMEVVTCRGVCKCPRCITTRDQSEAARDFIKSQMNMANNITSKLISELRNMRTLVEDDGKEGEAATSCGSRSEKAKGAIESATKMETWATKEILKLSRDSKRVCRLIETGPRSTIFADDAGRQLCHVKFLPAKKSTLVNL